MAERHSAIHAASTLFAQVTLRHLLMELLPIKHTFSRQSSDWKSAGEIHEAGFRHCQSVPNRFLLPLLLGEGWGEGLGISSAFLSPHPQPFSQGEKEHALISPQLAPGRASSIRMRPLPLVRNSSHHAAVGSPPPAP